ncbi:MAG: hypothetical protein H6656_08605 [Ardenticatenaceae bacterium]|nr:hypothetical protein [Ardenticatenaceae bacterium]
MATFRWPSGPSQRVNGLAWACATAVSLVLANRGYKNAAVGTAVLGTVGQAMGLASFRHPERALKDTLQQAAQLCHWCRGGISGFTNWSKGDWRLEIGD